MLARKAVELDDGSPEAHAALGAVLNWERRHDDAVAEFRRAFELNPNLAAPRYGDVLVYAGHAAEAIDCLIKRTMRLDPFFSPLVLAFLGHAYYTAGQYGPAIEQLTSCSRRAPRFRPCHVWAAAAYAQAGQARRRLGLRPGGCSSCSPSSRSGSGWGSCRTRTRRAPPISSRGCAKPGCRSRDRSR